MNAQTARLLANDFATRSGHGADREQRQRRKRETLRIALQRVADEPLRLARKFAVKRHMAAPPKKARRQRRIGKAALLLTAGTASIAATDMMPLNSLHSRMASGDIIYADAQNIRRHAVNLQASDALKEALMEEEGVRYTVYRDVAGYPTVGVGHLVRAEDGLRVGDTISRAQALAFLDADIAHAEEAARRLAGNLPLFQHEYDALVDLVYNVGEGNVSQRESPRLNAAINSGDYQRIADELDYTSAGGSVYKGLENRSERRAAIFMEASYENPREA